MGLTIHYQLKSDTRSPAQARQLVEKLRQRALDLPFAEVGEVVELKGDACDYTTTTATTRCGGSPSRRGSTSCGKTCITP